MFQLGRGPGISARVALCVSVWRCALNSIVRCARARAAAGGRKTGRRNEGTIYDEEIRARYTYDIYHPGVRYILGIAAKSGAGARALGATRTTDAYTQARPRRTLPTRYEQLGRTVTSVHISACACTAPARCATPANALLKPPASEAAQAGGAVGARTQTSGAAGHTRAALQ